MAVYTSKYTGEEIDNGVSKGLGLDTTLSSYVTNSSLDTTLKDYVTNDDLTAQLTNYPLSDTVVKLGGSQTITGTKIFNGSTTFKGSIMSSGINTFTNTNTFTAQVTFTDADKVYITYDGTQANFTTVFNGINSKINEKVSYTGSAQKIVNNSVTPYTEFEFGNNGFHVNSAGGSKYSELRPEIGLFVYEGTGTRYRDRCIQWKDSSESTTEYSTLYFNNIATKNDIPTISKAIKYDFTGTLCSSVDNKKGTYTTAGLNWVNKIANKLSSMDGVYKIHFVMIGISSGANFVLEGPCNLTMIIKGGSVIAGQIDFISSSSMGGINFSPEYCTISNDSLTTYLTSSSSMYAMYLEEII